jgi:hypothetical protein
MANLMMLLMFLLIYLKVENLAGLLIEIYLFET